MKRTVISGFIILFLVCHHNARSQELLDGIVAVVGDEIILYSELMMATQQTSSQMGINPVSQEKEFEELKGKVLESLITEKVVLAKAKEDTVTVEDHKVESALDSRIQYFIQQMGSKENVEAYFGVPIKKIKRDYREEIRKQLIGQEMQRQIIGGTQVSRLEVETFFETMKDSLPDRKESVKLWHILMEVKPGGDARRDAMIRIREIQDRMRQGEDFNELARSYSEDPGSSDKGGDLGFVERGTLFKSFEEVAFQLKPGDISGIIETPVGLHLIKMVETRGDMVNVCHILVRMSATSNDQSDVLERLIKVRERLVEGEEFEKLAKEFSDDESSKDQGGDLGWLNSDDFQLPAFKSAVDTLSEGEISNPFQTQFGFHIVKVEERSKAGKYSLNEDWEELKMATLNRKQQRIFTKWVNELRKDIYIDIKEDMLK
jgi:peptidyl-prolyl cis-trans isomerase SurA